MSYHINLENHIVRNTVDKVTITKKQLLKTEISQINMDPGTDCILGSIELEPGIYLLDHTVDIMFKSITILNRIKIGLNKIKTLIDKSYQQTVSKNQKFNFTGTNLINLSDTTILDLTVYSTFQSAVVCTGHMTIFKLD